MSAEPVTLPHTWRPFGARMMGGMAGFSLLVMTIGVWILFGEDVRSRFSFLERATLVLFGLMAFAVWFALMRSKVVVDEAGVTVVNGYRRRVYAWSQIVAVNLRRGAPWAGIDLSDGTSVSAVGIQGSDGERARQAVRDLRRLVAENTPTERND